MNQLTIMIAHFFLGSKELSKLNLAICIVQK